MEIVLKYQRLTPFVVSEVEAPCQGAVDMARVVREHGKDPATRALAETVIKAQEAEIAQMKAWLAKRGLMREAHEPEPDGPDTPVASDAVDHSKMGH